MAINKNKRINQAILYPDVLLKNVTPVLDNEISSKKYVDDQIKANQASYTIIDAIYDNTGVADDLFTTTYAVGDVVIAFDTVGTFTANGLYRATTAGALGVAVFESIPLKEGLKIWIDQDLVNPNDADSIYKEHRVYGYDADLGVWILVPVTIAQGTKFLVKGQVAHNSVGAINIGGVVPVGTQITKIVFQFETAFDGTGGVLIVGDAGDADRIATLPIILLLQDFAQGESTQEYTVFDPITSGDLIYANRTQITATLTGISGATQGLVNILIEGVQL
jgi:hypothetical protein